MTSSTAPRRGQWANAPLVFVLAQVRFLPTPSASPENLRDAITRRVGSRFPTVNQTSGVGIEINFEAEPSLRRTVETNIYNLVNDEVDAMVRVQHDTLTYAVTSYVDSSQFRNEWLAVADALADVQVSRVMRLGLRYVDFLVPTNGRRPEDYVRSPWNLEGMPKLPGSSGAPDLHVSMVDVGYPTGRMRLQFIRGVGMPSLPMDLQGILNPRQPNVQAGPAECGVIDSDRWVDGDQSADRETLDRFFTQMHCDVSSAFRAMVTPLALDEWRPNAQPGDET